MRKKSNEEVVKSVINNQIELNSQTVDAIAETKNVQEVEVQVSVKEIAAKEGFQYIEPVRKLKPIGKLPEQLQKRHTYDWEYVKGIYESDTIHAEPIRFWYVKYAGDPDCMWEIPANRPVYVPRMIAKHLSGEKDDLNGTQSMVYHTFDHVKAPEHEWDKDKFTHRFSATGTRYRGKFRALGAFA